MPFFIADSKKQANQLSNFVLKNNLVDRDFNNTMECFSCYDNHKNP